MSRDALKYWRLRSGRVSIAVYNAEMRRQNYWNDRRNCSMNVHQKFQHRAIVNIIISKAWGCADQKARIRLWKWLEENNYDFAFQSPALCRTVHCNSESVWSWVRYILRPVIIIVMTNKIIVMVILVRVMGEWWWCWFL